ncbi:amidohydrolase family protein [Muricauda sp. JGD-17]|uniref:Amidohydrolase family protein n=1 Tax=Flagellimonas ochracea TaxID=2696472 RepID=A0A964TC29_9FLAO|nr:amidohydrolase family protein [Allomuricauda ochracea]NAY91278.1 amidohydrolase family protein [Allomuricauda ochracea]
MRVKILYCLLIGLLASACQEKEKLIGDTLISNINIVDVKTGKILPTQDILIDGDHIASIRPSNTANYAKQSHIDGEGKYIIPGLWDMHAHPDDPEVWRMNPKEEEKERLLPLFVVNGVTGIRDMGGDLNLVKRWQSKYANGELLVPKIFAGGPLLDGPNPMWDGSVGIAGPEQVKYVVDSLIHEGVDFLKVYSLLPRETYLELSRYAQEIDFPFVGHVPFTVLPSEAAATGMKSQEHLLEILKECADKPDEQFLKKLGSIENRIERSNKINDFRLKTFDGFKADSLYSIFKEQGIWHCPTLSMWYKNAWYEQEWGRDLELTELLPPYLQAYWTPEHNDHLQFRDNTDFIKTKQRLYQLYQEMVKNMNDKGVLLLAGTDVGANPLCHPGVGVHNELEALVEAGLTPAEALKTATLNPALFFEITEEYGTVSEGKRADLVLLEGNPLEDINAIRSISNVIRDGRVFDSEKIFEIKKSIQKINTGS